jgi:hypothetical protein
MAKYPSACAEFPRRLAALRTKVMNPTPETNAESRIHVKV